MKTYSFQDVQAAISGPGGNVALGGVEAGVAAEGITIARTGDKSTMTIGADGDYMHSLSADNSGTITVRLLKTSPNNARLQAMYDYQTTSATRHGQNTITVRDTARGDTTTARGCAFAKLPDTTYAVDGGMQEWVFQAGRIDTQFGSGTPEKA